MKPDEDMIDVKKEMECDKSLKEMEINTVDNSFSNGGCIRSLHEIAAYILSLDVPLVSQGRHETISFSPMIVTAIIEESYGIIYNISLVPINYIGR